MNLCETYLRLLRFLSAISTVLMDFCTFLSFRDPDPRPPGPNRRKNPFSPRNSDISWKRKEICQYEKRFDLIKNNVKLKQKKKDLQSYKFLFKWSFLKNILELFELLKKAALIWSYRTFYSKIGQKSNALCGHVDNFALAV